MQINSLQATRPTHTTQWQINPDTELVIRVVGDLYNRAPRGVAPASNRSFNIEIIDSSKMATLSSVTYIIDLLLSNSLTIDEDFFKSIKEMKKAILSANTLLSLQYTITHVKNTLLEQLIKLDYEVFQSLKEVFKGHPPEDPFLFIFELAEIEQKIDQILQNDNNSNNDFLLTKLVNKLLEINENKRAIETASLILDPDKKNTKLWDLSETFRKQRKFNLAIEAIRSISELDIRDIHLLNLSALLLKEDHVEASIEALKVISELDIRNAHLWDLSTLLLKKGHVEASIEALKAISELNIRDAHLFDLSIFLLEKNHFQASVEAHNGIRNYKDRRLAFTIIRQKFKELGIPMQLSLMRSSHKQKKLLH